MYLSVGGFLSLELHYFLLLPDDRFQDTVPRIFRNERLFTKELLPHLILIEERIIRQLGTASTQAQAVDRLITRLFNSTTLDCKLYQQNIDIEQLKRAKKTSCDLYTLKNLLCTLFESDLPTEEIRNIALTEMREDCVRRKKRTYQVQDDVNGSPVLAIPPLCLAAILNCQKTVSHLLQNGHAVNQVDSQGYTAAHFAAIMGNFEMLQVLESAGADFSLRNALGGDVYDLLRARGFDLSCTRPPSIPTYQCAAREHYNQTIWTADSLLGLWYQNKTGPFRFENQLEEKVFSQFIDKMESGKVHIPPVQVRTFDVKETAFAKLFQGHFELYATRKILPGEFIMEYTGTFESEPLESDLSYAAGLEFFDALAIDAHRGGSRAEFINHGLPNCVMMSYIYRGTPRILVYAIDTIEAGESLFTNYGTGYFKRCQFFELTPSRVDAYLASLISSNEFANFAKLQELFLHPRHHQMLKYIFSFPDRLLATIAAGGVSAKDANFLLNAFVLAHQDALSQEEYDALFESIRCRMN